MKFKRIVGDYFWIVLFGFFLLGSAYYNFEPGRQIYTTFSQFFLEMASFLPLMFLLVGLFDVWVPKERVERHIGEGSGLAELVIAARC